MGSGGDGLIRAQETGLISNYYAPPPGSRSGVADYAEVLLRALGRFGTWHVPLYHLGNNLLHAEIYGRALRQPGVIVLHDAVLHHLLLGTLSREEYIEEFVFNYGGWRRHLAEALWDERGNSGVDIRYFEFPMLRRIVERSRAVIVHNPGAASIASAHGAGNVVVIPHFFSSAVPPDMADALLFREDLRVAPGVTLFGIFGYLRETKRILPCIRAFRRLNAIRADTALLIAGEAVSSDLKRQLELEAADPGIIRIGHLNDRDFSTAAAAVDCCLNLRYPGAGETSGIAITMMGLAKPVIVTAGEENGDIPATACLRVTPGVAEAAELFDHMILAAAYPAIARAIGEQARQHIFGRHSLETVAAQFWQVLCAASS